MSLHQGERTCIQFYPEMICLEHFLVDNDVQKLSFSPIQRTEIPLQQVRGGHRKHI